MKQFPIKEISNPLQRHSVFQKEKELANSKEDKTIQDNTRPLHFMTKADMRVMNLLNDLLCEFSDEERNIINQDASITPKEPQKPLSKLNQWNNDGIELQNQPNSKPPQHANQPSKQKSSSKGLSIPEEFNASNDNLLKKINDTKQSFLQLTHKNPNSNTNNNKTVKAPPYQKKFSQIQNEMVPKKSFPTQTFIRHHYNKRPLIINSIEEDITEKAKAQTSIDEHIDLLKSSIQFKNDFVNNDNNNKPISYRNNKATKDQKNIKKSLLQNKTNIYDSLSITGQSEIKSIQSQLKQTIIGDKSQEGFMLKEIEHKVFLNDKEDEEEEKVNANRNNRYRVLTRKGFVYDSYDDDESRDENNIEGRYFIHPTLVLLYLLDMLLFFESVYFIVYLPLFFAVSHNIDFKNNYFEYCVEMISEVTYMLDILLHFFIAYYNFEEILITNLKLIIYHYLSTWFALDIIVSFPFILVFLILDDSKAITKYYDYSNKNQLCLLTLLHMGKIIKTTCSNKFTFSIKNWLMDFTSYQKWNKAYISICCLLLSLHCLTCIFIFIGQTSYPNWIFSQNLESSSFNILYINSLYYIIATVFTIGYGDITVKNNSERMFNLILLLVGIVMYSWTLSSISTYIQTKDVKTLEYHGKVAILNEIRLQYRQMPLDLYEKITRYLKYKLLNEKKDKNVILDFLPIALRNNLVSEMYKDIIEGFAFFKTFKNTDFIVRVIMAFRPILVAKNDILVKKGDYIEEIIFVKRGNLTLEIPIFSSMKDNEEEGSMRNKTSKPLFNFSQMINTIKTRNDLIHFDFRNNNNISTSNNDDNVYSEINKEEEVQHARILEIRRNEHFGDILMFLNKRSPLRVKVKSKHAELFFLYKTDAVEISMSYPKIWRKIIKKSLYNMEQIDRLINKAKTIFFEAIKKDKQTLMKSQLIKKPNSISQQLTQRTNSLFGNIVNEGLIDQSLIKPRPLIIDANRKSKLMPDNNPRCLQLNPLQEMKNKNSSIANDTIIEHESETSEINHSRSDRTIKIDIQNKTKEYHNDNCNSYLKRHSLIPYSDELSESTNAKPLSTTPFKASDINLEIYPHEEFITLNNFNSIIINQVSNFINDIRLETSRDNVYHFNETLTSLIQFPPSLNIINQSHSHCRQCSFANLQLRNELSITYPKIYRNINELFNYNSNQSILFIDSLFSGCDLSFKNSLLYPLKKDNRENKKLIINNSKTNINPNHSVYLPQGKGEHKQFLKSTLSEKNSILKATKMFYGSNNRDMSNINQGAMNSLKGKERKISERNAARQLNTINEINTNSNSNKKPDLLNVISQNIEKNSQNMNNPVLFYSEFFKEVMNQQNKGLNENKNQEQQLLYDRLIETEKMIYNLSLSDCSNN